MISGKRILFLTPFFYNYYSLIKAELERYGNTVMIVQNDAFHREFTADWNNGFLPKVIRFVLRLEWRKHKVAVEGRNSQLYLDRFPELRKTFDLVFVMRGDYVPNQIYELLRRNNPSARFILYQQDAVINLIKFDHAVFFDRLLTFDPSDARKYSMEFRPLFFVADAQAEWRPEKDIDILFVGSLHSDRLAMLKQLITRYGDRYRIEHHLVGVSDDALVTEKKLDFAEYMDLMKRSKCVVDFPVDGQKGLTIRTLESLASRTKLITSNRSVTDYDFFGYGNILIVNKRDLFLPPSFIEEPYSDPDIAVVRRYSISQWAEDVFGSE